MKDINLLILILVIILILGSLLPYLIPLFGYKSFVVMSKSMEKNDNYFYEFWESMGYNRSEIDEKLPISDGIYLGDIIVAEETVNYSIGDVVIHKKEDNDFPKVHRLVMYNKTHFSVIADSHEIDKNWIEFMDFYPISLLESKVIFKFSRIGIFLVFIDCLRHSYRCRLFDI